MLQFELFFDLVLACLKVAVLLFLLWFCFRLLSVEVIYVIFCYVLFFRSRRVILLAGALMPR